ncbi:MAG: acetoacetate--CoA ligase, partial [Aestuariivirgaceae bacterium]|nr:acetoacetate--CoA ligase [Aestuariivirgaceae bacterium]
FQETRFFPDSRLNYAENLLRRADDAPAIIFRGEDRVKRNLSWASLTDSVGRMSRALKAFAIEPGDRVAAIVPNMPETIVSFLGANAMGAIWSSCSPDFGERGILDRFGQIGPRVLVVTDGYYYAGKTIRLADKIRAVLKELPSVERVIVIDYLGEAEAVAQSLPNAITLDALLAEQTAGPAEYARLPFDHPIYILYSSGTTGVPKCIVHRAGGILLKHLTELWFSTDVKPSDRLFYFTTCGWMMWNWLVSGLSAGATLLLYDGSPFHPSERVLFDFAEEEGMTIFGTSAKYIDAVKKTGWQPRETHKLDTLRSLLSTGSPLAAESFHFVYNSVKPDIQLASVSGGTDICGCFIAGNPLGAVWPGELQAPTLGCAMDVYDDQAKPIREEKGELVCTKPFPSMPVMFWNDADGAKYRAAYFERFPGIWCHGDFAEITTHAGYIIHGRSDATLNPGGVRIGTAEIYAQVEQIPEILESIAIGQDWDNDVRVVLFVRLRAGAVLDDDLKSRIVKQIRSGASPRHVPARILGVADIPRTKSGKITELAVRDVVHGREIKNREALANPEALELYRDLAELKA